MPELFVGPRPYEERDARFFYARDREARDLVSLVIANPLLLLYAPSGAGKTSLVNARLIPMLSTVNEPELVETLGEGKGFTVMPIARVSGLVPEGVDLDTIPGANIFVFNTLMSWRKKDDPSSQRVNERRAAQKQLANMRLADFLKQNQPEVTAAPAEEHDEDGLGTLRIIIFDQFEELFTAHLERWSDREAFFQQISDALDGSPVFLRSHDIREPAALLRRLRDGHDAVSKEIWGRFSAEGQDVLRRSTGARLSPEVMKELIEELNTIIKGPNLFNPDLFKNVELGEETKNLINLKARSRNFSSLNRAVIEETYREEIYPQAPADRTLRVVFSMREDYIAELDPYIHFLPDRLGTRYRLERLRRDAALAAITRPMEYSHLRFADGVAEQLVENLLKTPIRVATGEPEQDAFPKT